MSLDAPLMNGYKHTPLPLSDADKAPHGFTFGVAVAFTVNYIMGTGFLTLPWAFYETGVLVGMIVLAVMAFISNISKDCILETMARAELLSARGSITAVISSGYETIVNPYVTTNGDSRFDVATSERTAQYFSGTRHDSVSYEDEPMFEGGAAMVKDRKFELTELCEMFLGQRGVRVYTFFVSIYLYGAMWAYASVWGNSLAAHLALKGICETEYCSYLIYLLMFSSICIPLTCMELHEQVIVQVTLAVCRVVLVIFMVLSVTFAYALDNAPFTDVEDAPKGAPLFHPSKLYVILPIACYANIFHHSLPALSQPVIDKSSLSRIFGLTFLVCWAAYSSIGIAVALYFGSEVEQSSNLNWAHYAGRSDGSSFWYCDFVSFFVVLFPALDVASAFPLNGLTLGNNLMSWMYGKQMGDIERNAWTRTSFRLLAAIPPIIGACFVRELGTITDYAGLTGLVIIFIFPALLAHTSAIRVRQAGLSEITHYSNFFTTRYWVFGLGAAGVIMVLFVFVAMGLWGQP